MNKLLKIAVLALFLSPFSVFAQDEVEEVVAVGSRREARSVGDSPAPVDIIDTGNAPVIFAPLIWLPVTTTSSTSSSAKTEKGAKNIAKMAILNNLSI